MSDFHFKNVTLCVCYHTGKVLNIVTEILFSGLWTMVVKIGKDLLRHIAFFLDYTLDLSLHPLTQKTVVFTQ